MVQCDAGKKALLLHSTTTTTTTVAVAACRSLYARIHTQSTRARAKWKSPSIAGKEQFRLFGPLIHFVDSWNVGVEPVNCCHARIRRTCVYVRSTSRLSPSSHCAQQELNTSVCVIHVEMASRVTAAAIDASNHSSPWRVCDAKKAKWMFRV